jgi:hypothetical protein
MEGVRLEEGDATTEKVGAREIVEVMDWQEVKEMVTLKQSVDEVEKDEVSDKHEDGVMVDTPLVATGEVV